MSMQKPTHCAQDWLAMEEVPGGRICSACEKKIIDFTGKSWNDIALLQDENNHALCGMYTQKQLDHWGHQAPSTGMNAKAVAAVSSLLFSIGTPVAAMAMTHDNMVLTDTIQTPADLKLAEKDTTDCCTYIFEGVISNTLSEPIAFVNVFIAQLNVGAVSDFDGRYKLEVTCPPEVMAQQVIELQILGYEDYKIKFGAIQSGSHYLDIKLFEKAEIIAFHVTVLKPRQRFWQKITRPFRRKR